jgi:hypothetical protein
MVVLVAACSTSWQLQQGPPRQTLATSRGAVRLTMIDGSVHTIHATQIVKARSGDQVVGFRPRSSETDSFRLADIQQVETPQPDSGNHAAAITCVVVLFVIATGDVIESSRR